MKKIAVLVLAAFMLITASGCLNAQKGATQGAKDTTGKQGAETKDVVAEATNENSEGQSFTAGMHNYKGQLYYDSLTGIISIDLPPWDGFPDDMILPGGIVDGMLGGAWSNTEEKSEYLLVLVTGGARYYDIAAWYKQELEKNGWTIDEFIENENYASRTLSASKGNMTLNNIIFMPNEALDDGWDESAPIDKYGENDGPVSMSGMIKVE